MATLIENGVFLVLPALIALVAIINGLRAWVGYRIVRAEAAGEYDTRLARGLVDTRLDRERFESAYVRTHAPRAQLWTALGLGAVVVLTVPALLLMDAFMTMVWRMSGENRTFEPTFLVYQFGIFFGVIALWAAIGYVAARAYHRSAPVSFEMEIQRELGEL